MMGWREACRSPGYMGLRPVHTRLMPTGVQPRRPMASGVHPYRRAMATYGMAMAMIIITLPPCHANVHHPVALSDPLRLSDAPLLLDVTHELCAFPNPNECRVNFQEFDLLLC